MTTFCRQLKLTVLLISVILCCLEADTIADCRYEDFHGHWKIQVYKYSKDCNQDENPEMELETDVEFVYPNIVKSSNGQHGKWTMIDNEGAELTNNQRVYLLMSWYNSTHYSCQKTIGHWSYSTTGKNWRCSRAYKIGVPIKYEPKKPDPEYTIDRMNFRRFRNYPEYIKHLNSIQNTWTAGVNMEFEKYTIAQMQNRMGKKSDIAGFVKSLPKKQVTNEMLAKLSNLPDSWDWRYIKHGSGKSFLSPIRDQAKCGSCYAFASMAAAEARVRIVTNMTQEPIFSPQDIVECSVYSQGCEGGYAYLTFGKYAQDFGLVEEKCNPYKGEDSKTCNTQKGCKRYFFSGYEYLGGYDGAMNEDIMKLELMENGPFPVCINVTGNFVQYKGGVYIEPKSILASTLKRFNPYEPANHAVLLVGYGFDQELNLPYWVIKNSWSKSWGEDGFGRIRRGTDEISIESLGIVSKYSYF